MFLYTGLWPDGTCMNVQVFLIKWPGEYTHHSWCFLSNKSATGLPNRLFSSAQMIMQSRCNLSTQTKKSLFMKLMTFPFSPRKPAEYLGGNTQQEEEGGGHWCNMTTFFSSFPYHLFAELKM